MKILNFGSCNIDHVYSLDHIVAIGETETTHKMEIFPGGKGLNQSIALARAGAHVYHAGCVGNDSEILTDILSQNGVDLSFLTRVDATNGHAVIQVSAAGENSIFIYPGSNEMITKPMIDSVLEHFETGDMILLQNEISHVDYLVKRAYEKGMCVVLNPSPFNERVKKIDLSMISYLVLNEIEAKEYSGKSDYQENIHYFRKAYPELKVMLTLGANGCVYFDKEREVHHGAYEVEAVDTTAAGDTFTGYFVAELSRGTDYPQILRIASGASALAVSRAGAAPSIPSYGEVLEALPGMKFRKKTGHNDYLREEIDLYIQEHLRDASLDELAARLGYSATYTGNTVKRLTGQTFSKLLQSKRLNLAVKLLTETEISIGEIIDIVGYKNESFFRDVFKAKYGKKPLEYRKTSVFR